ncbi:hypothetical protein BJ741DRAFT_612396 [Chytriomyces cf. hyalinus JEL632]|nr:hypothetical protein BJ741DRAFT_612396 [Chytriomyces cf. hyalinus JEL632]
MSTSTASSDCRILSAWLPSVYAAGCCASPSNCTSTGGALRIELSGRGISGSIPTELGLLTSLVTLDVSGNQLTGPIPTEFGRLTSLTWLNLDRNVLSGTIPTELGQLTSLITLSFRANQLTGTIPTALSRLTSLTILDLATNLFIGTIPTELGRITSLSRLSLHENLLIGTIPTELSQLTSLTSLSLRNQLTGTIPTELGRLTSLTWLSVFGNELTGRIPTELGQLSSLTLVELAENRLTGTIPTEIGRMTSLNWLNLHGNQLSGTIPTELGRLTSLTLLRLDSNELSGKFPCELTNLKVLTESNFTGNLLESNTFNAAELAQSCKAVRTISDPTATSPAKTNPSFVTGPLVQQQRSNAPIIGGVAGAAIFACIAAAIAIWLRRKRVKSQPVSGIQSSIGGNVETVNAFTSSSIPPPTAFVPVLEKNAAVSATNDDEFQVANSQVSPPPATRTHLFDHLDARDRNQNLPKIENLASLETTLREYETFVSQKAATVATRERDFASNVVPESQTSASSSLLASFAVSNENHGSSSYRFALPADPNNWTEDETAQWILEKFGDPKLSSLALNQKINGRVLLMMERQDLKSELGLETFGDRRLFEEAIAELRRKSAQQSALDQENPPSYE